MEGFRGDKRRGAKHVSGHPKGHHRPEVHQLGAPGRGESDIVVTHVAMHQTARVHQRQRAGHLAQQRTDVGGRRPDPAGQLCTQQQLHGVVRPVFVDPEIVDFDDVGMGELLLGVELTFELRGERATAAGTAVESLARHHALGVRVEYLIHHTGAALSEARRELIAVRGWRARVGLRQWGSGDRSRAGWGRWRRRQGRGHGWAQAEEAGRGQLRISGCPHRCGVRRVPSGENVSP